VEEMRHPKIMVNKMINDLDRFEEVAKDMILKGSSVSELHNILSKLNRNLTRIEFLEEELKKAGEEYGRNIQMIQKLQQRNKELKRQIKALKSEIRNLKLLRKPSL